MTALHRLPAPRPRARITTLALLAIVLTGMALVGFWPTPVDRDAAGTIREVIAWFHAHGVDAVSYARIEKVANIGFFMPLGVLLAVVLRRWMLLAGALVLVATVSIELGQLLFLPDRYPSLSDIAMNTAGGLTGLLLVAGVRATRWLRSARRARLEAVARTKQQESRQHHPAGRALAPRQQLAYAYSELPTADSEWSRRIIDAGRPAAEHAAANPPVGSSSVYSMSNTIPS